MYIHTIASPSFGLLEYLLLSLACPGAKNLKKKKNTHTHILEQKQHMNPHKMCSISEKISILTFFCMVWISVSLTVFSFIDSETNIA